MIVSLSAPLSPPWRLHLPAPSTLLRMPKDAARHQKPVEKDDSSGRRQFLDFPAS
jgi:hypothetical protein